jgi:hypothetical protein
LKYGWFAVEWTGVCPLRFVQSSNLCLIDSFPIQIGLVEKEWLETLATIDPSEVTYTDYVIAGKMLGRELREKGCDYVIALTHMRTPNDIRLAENVDEIDIILGGHDHVYEKKMVRGGSLYTMNLFSDNWQCSYPGPG